MALVMVSLSCEIVTATGAAVILLTLTVMPVSTLLKVFVSELMSTPLIFAAALEAAWVCVVGPPVAVGSVNDSADKPLASSLTPSLSDTVTRNPFVSPVLAEFITRRAPLASLMMVAFTPALALLILSRMASRESAASMVTLTAVAPVLPVNAAPDQDPTSNVRVPAPSVLAGEVKTVFDNTDCPAASELTETL